MNNIDELQFSPLAYSAIQQAKSLTLKCRYARVETLVLMVTLLQEGKELVPSMLDSIGVNKQSFFTAISDSVRSIPHGEIEIADCSQELIDVLRLAISIGEKEFEGQIGIPQIFLALSMMANPVKTIMDRFGLSPDSIRMSIRSLYHGALCYTSGKFIYNCIDENKYNDNPSYIHPDLADMIFDIFD